MPLFDYAALAAKLSLRARSSEARILMDRAALLRSMTAIDDLEFVWQGSLAKSAREKDSRKLGELLPELLSVDVLLRTWTTFVASSIDGGRNPLRPQNAALMLTRTVLQQRKRVMTAIVGSDLELDSLWKLDRVRKIAERWNDVLLSVFPATSTTRALVFHPERLKDYSELWPSAEVCATRAAEPVIVTAMKSAMPALEFSCDSARSTAYAALEEAIEQTLQYDRRSLVRIGAAQP